ncbi:hypothetical protein BCH308197_F0003 (plasmid) [Bacillus cereus H3081.97]|nr:hypothetical protein BCH308197_F0003 [Bacillus cereus H3081.97]
MLCEARWLRQTMPCMAKKPRTLSEPTRGTLPLDPINRTPQPLNP